jgi:formylglycine-generating enzyme required for sulfatase activity
MNDVNLKEQIVIPMSSGIDMQFHLIKAGSFHMGSRGEYADEEPIHTVHISNPFYLGIFPVTQEQFAVWTNEQKIDHKNGFAGNPKHPAENMDWMQAATFCEWLNAKYGEYIPKRFLVGLPIEAQWEYACRANTETEYYTGDGEAALARAGWYDGNSGRTTHAVGSPDKEPNQFGLHDMHGNVWEWCRDYWDKDAYKIRMDGCVDPETTVATEDEQLRVVRGGSWNIIARNCRSANRFGGWPGVRDRSLGFRVCLFSGPIPGSQDSKAEPVPGDGARRDDAAES